MVYRRKSLILAFLGLGGLWAGSGCAVPQPRGLGEYRHVQEPTTGAWYHLYLPADYARTAGVHPHTKNGLWPLVMSFHGMKPYDNALPQEREWEQEADNYGFIVCAPQLITSDSFMEYPLTREHSYVLRDRENVLAIMRHVFSTTRADPEKVLSTSWSCGGYLAHYFPNRFPDQFACIATRLSNFSPKLMLDETVPRYRHRVPVAIFIGDGDFPACKTESEAAVAWYKTRQFEVVEGKMIDNMGHRRIPQVAAAFFARQIGLKPLRPVEAAQTVAQVRMTDYTPSPELMAALAPTGTALASAANTARATPAPPRLPASGTKRASYEVSTAGRNYPEGVTPVYDPTPEADPERRHRESAATMPPSAAEVTRVASARPPPAANWLAPPAEPHPTRGTSETKAPPADRTRPALRGDPPRLNPPAKPKPSPSGSTVKRANIRLSGSSVGTAPHYVMYSVDLPRPVLEGADCLWMLNGMWLGDEPRGVKILETPGQYQISVVVVTRDNVEYRGTATVYVLEGTASSAGK